MSNIIDFVNYIIIRFRQFVKYNKFKSCQNVYVGSFCIGNKTFPQ